MSQRDKYMNLLTEGSTFSSMTGQSFSNARPEKGHHVRTANFNPVGPPLDYTFHEIASLSELKEREPTSGTRKAGRAEQGDQQGETEIKIVSSRSTLKKQREDQDKEEQRRTYAAGIKLAHNDLTSLEGLEDALEEVMENPTENLTSIDLSHNQLSSIDEALCKYKNLAALYLHGNKILSIAEVEKLNCLENLQKLSLNGNQVQFEKPGGGRKVKRLEDTRYYRQQVIFMLRDTRLKSLDMVTITPKDRENALIWAKNYRKAI